MKFTPVLLALALSFNTLGARADVQPTTPAIEVTSQPVVSVTTLATWDLEARKDSDLVLKLVELNTGRVGSDPKFFVNVDVVVEYRQNAKRTRKLERKLLDFVSVGEAPIRQSKYVDQAYRVRVGEILREIQTHLPKFETTEAISIELDLNFRRKQGLGSVDLGHHKVLLADVLERSANFSEEFEYAHEETGFSISGEFYAETPADVAERRAQRKRLEAGELEKLMLEVRNTTDQRIRSLEDSNERMLNSFADLCAKVTELASSVGQGAGGENVSTMPATIFLVRHAEKEGGSDPDLTPAGHKRAAALKVLLKNVKLNAIFATEMKRTQQTVAPVCQATGLKAEIEPYHVSDKLVQKLKSNYAGKTVLVATHSTSIPDLTRQLGFTEPLDVYDFGDLFVIQFVGNKPKLVANLHFGE